MFGPKEEKIAKNIISGFCNYVISTDLQVNNYIDILNIWEDFLETANLPLNIQMNKVLCEVFIFHKTCVKNHAVLYNCQNLQDAMLMYKINGEYINILIPDDGISCQADKKNVVAIFTEF